MGRKYEPLEELPPRRFGRCLRLGLNPDSTRRPLPCLRLFFVGILFFSLIPATLCQALYPSLSPSDSISLIEELLLIEKQDQKYRRLISSSGVRRPKDFMDNIGEQMHKLDLDNQARLDSIVSMYGLPGISLVGSRYSRICWLVIHHSSPPYMTKYREVMRAYSSRQELTSSASNSTVDRLEAIEHDRMQKYALQISDTTALTSVLVRLSIGYYTDPMNTTSLVPLRHQLDSILSIEGYPGKSLVGDSLSHVMLNLIQKVGPGFFDLHQEKIMNACKMGEVPLEYCFSAFNAQYWHRNEKLLFGAYANGSLTEQSEKAKMIRDLLLSINN